MKNDRILLNAGACSRVLEFALSGVLSVVTTDGQLETMVTGFAYSDGKIGFWNDDRELVRRLVENACTACFTAMDEERPRSGEFRIDRRVVQARGRLALAADLGPEAEDRILEHLCRKYAPGRRKQYPAAIREKKKNGSVFCLLVNELTGSESAALAEERVSRQSAAQRRREKAEASAEHARLVSVPATVTYRLVSREEKEQVWEYAPDTQPAGAPGRIVMSEDRRMFTENVFYVEQPAEYELYVQVSREELAAERERANEARVAEGLPPFTEKQYPVPRSGAAYYKYASIVMEDIQNLIAEKELPAGRILENKDV